jgi:hypothetical protein
MGRVTCPPKLYAKEEGGVRKDREQFQLSANPLLASPVKGGGTKF